MFNESKVLIIGAGAAGISAAARLLEKGFQNVTILEASNRIGGRIHTVEFSDNVVELGAQWVHGESNNVVFDLASHHNLLSSSRKLNDLSKHVFLTAQGEAVSNKLSTEVLKIYYNLSERFTTELKDANGSYGEHFTNEYYKILKRYSFVDDDKAEQFLDWIEKFDNSIQCSDSWFDVSAKGVTEYWHCDGDLLLNWKDHGYRTLFDLLLHKIPDPNENLFINEKIKFNKEVSLIDYSSSDNIIVKTKDGSKYTASHVIITTSLGVLKEKQSKMFSPPLPDTKQLAIKGLNIGTVSKIFLEFSHTWWNEDSAGFCMIWSEKDKTEFLRCHGMAYYWVCDVFEFFTVDYQPKVLCAWIIGQSARDIELLPDIDVQKGLSLLLETFLGKIYKVPTSIRMVRSKWYTDEHFRGAYSFRSLISDQLNVFAKDLAAPVVSAGGKPVLLFAGEATHDHYYSTVHGAVETGFREADRLIDYERQVINSFNKKGRIQNPTYHSIQRRKIVIVGAGIAGLAAAKALEDEGFYDYLLLEAQEQIGGRIHSISWNNNWIECGAQFLHGDRSKLAELCYNNQMLSNEECKDGDGFFLRENGFHADKSIVQEIDDLVRDTLEKCENQNSYMNYESIGRVLRDGFKEYLQQRNDSTEVRAMKEEIFDWNVRFLMIDNSCSALDELSVKNWGKFKYVGGPEHISFKNGYASIVKFIADGLKRCNLRLNAAVERIEWQQKVDIDNEESLASVVLTLSDKSKVLADCAIVTCSLGYLKENHRKMFSPALPASLSLGIESLGFGLINKIFLDFGTAWWESTAKGFQFLWTKDEMKNFSNDKLATWTRDLTGFDILQESQNLLLGWVGGRGAHIVETLSEQQIAADCTDLLRHYLKSDDIPSVKKCKRTQWSMNKYVRGSYSYIPVDCDANGVTPATLAEPVWGTVIRNNRSTIVPIIMFAGEATHENFYSTTHGAYDTGVKQAHTFLHYHIDKI